ncbi:nuclear transport factor 2 family protein [Flavobacterium rakeshii]|uniref:Nuclear transport factor 2 family protein n=1 Tax=Flavobacterium rakeshii TaxID=1038845 RepID=A0A6N8HG55_9FLAO|nr:nuclear transport factor 2 family protein [Flavobacterium rakeshii]MUV04719.1 nuclear transport factor 2 family protein [Flavobacterium rakeshii]
MTKIISSANCGNSPKMNFLMEFNIAFAKGNIKFLIEKITDDIVWNIIGHREIEGKERFIEELKKIRHEEADELIIDHILSHGKEGAVSGLIKLHNVKKYAFSEFYVFQSAKGEKIKTITTYCIEIKQISNENNF